MGGLTKKRLKDGSPFFVIYMNQTENYIRINVEHLKKRAKNVCIYINIDLNISIPILTWEKASKFLLASLNMFISQLSIPITTVSLSQTIPTTSPI